MKNPNPTGKEEIAKSPNPTLHSGGGGAHYAVNAVKRPNRCQNAANVSQAIEPSIPSYAVNAVHPVTPSMLSTPPICRKCSQMPSKCRLCCQNVVVAIKMQPNAVIMPSTQSNAVIMPCCHQNAIKAVKCCHNAVIMLSKKMTAYGQNLTGRLLGGA